MFSVMHCGRRVALCSALVFSFAAIPPVFAQQTVEVVIQKYRFEPAEFRSVRETPSSGSTRKNVPATPCSLLQSKGGNQRDFFRANLGSESLTHPAAMSIPAVRTPK